MVAVNVMERLLVQRILPAESDLETIKMIKGLHEKLKLSEKEITDFAYKEKKEKDGNTSINWNDKGKEAKELELSDKEKTYIADLLKVLDKNKKLSLPFLTVCDKFLA